MSLVRLVRVACYLVIAPGARAAHGVRPGGRRQGTRPRVGREGRRRRVGWGRQGSRTARPGGVGPRSGRQERQYRGSRPAKRQVARGGTRLRGSSFHRFCSVSRQETGSRSAWRNAGAVRAFLKFSAWPPTTRLEPLGRGFIDCEGLNRPKGFVELRALAGVREYSVVAREKFRRSPDVTE